MARKMRIGPDYVDIFSKDTRIPKLYQQTLRDWKQYKQLTDVVMGEIWQSKHADVEIQGIIKDFYQNTIWIDDVLGTDTPTTESLKAKS